MPLDVYLKDVPADKLIVLGNHRSAQSNVLFIRNNERGRQLGRDWLAIAMSGYVQCHGFDQVSHNVTASDCSEFCMNPFPLLYFIGE